MNRRLTNPVARRVAGRVRWLVVVHHVGRTSGRPYRTPVMASARGASFYVLDLYEGTSDWIANLDAAGGGQLVVGGRCVTVGAPRPVDDDEATGSLDAYGRVWRRATGASRIVALDRVLGGRSPGTVAADDGGSHRREAEVAGTEEPGACGP